MTASLHWLVVLGLSLLILLVLFQLGFGIFRNSYKKTLAYVGCILFFGYSLFAAYTFLNPTGVNNFYTNADTHILEHNGFEIKDSVYLFNSNKPKRALYNGIDGTVSLNVGSILSLQTEGFYSPIYEATGLVDSKKEIKNIKAIGIPFDKELTISLKTGTTLKYNIEYEGDSIKHFVSVNGTKFGVERFNNRINISTSFQDLLFKSGIDLLTQDELDVFEQSVVAREAFIKPSEYRKKNWLLNNIQNPTQLYFIPGSLLIQNANGFNSDIPRKTVLNGNYKQPIKLGNLYCFGSIGDRQTKPFKFEKTSNGFALKYYLSRKYGLNKIADRNTDQFIISSWVDLDKIASSETGYLLNEQMHDSSSYNIDAGDNKSLLSYHVRSGKSPLGIRANFNGNLEKIEVNKVLNFKSQSSNVDWLIQIKNFKSGNAIQTWNFLLLFLFYGIFILFLFKDCEFLTIRKNRVQDTPENKDGAKRLLFIGINVLVYTLLFIRVFISWRIATFPPLNVSSLMDMGATGEFNSFINNKGALLKTVALLCVFCILQLNLLGYFKIKLNWITGKISVISLLINGRLNKGSDYWSFVAYLFKLNALSVLVFLLLTPLPFLGRMAAIILPSLLFIYNQYWISKNSLIFNSSEIKRSFNYVYKSENNLFPTINYLFLIPLLPIIIYLFVADTGYLYVFIVGILIYKSITNLYKWIAKTHSKRSFAAKTILLSLVLLGLLIFPANLGVWVFNLIEFNYLSFVIWVIIFLSLLLFVFVFDSYPSLKKINRRKNRLIQKINHALSHFSIKQVSKEYFSFKGAIKWSLVTMMVVMIISLMFKGDIIRVVRDKLHMKYRCEVIKRDAASLSDLALKTESGSFDYREFSEQYQNKWFIEQFVNKHYNQKPNAFTLHQHESRGSGYTVQTQDTILTRYVIGEHNRLIPVALLFMVLVLVVYNFIVFRKNSNFMGIASIGTLILTLFFGMMYFVTLTSINLIPFFGQDFPLLPVTSLSSLVLPFSLLGMLVYIYSRSEFKLIERIRIRRSNVIVVILLFSIMTVLPFVLYLMNESVKENYSIFDDNDQSEVVAAALTFNESIIDPMYENGYYSNDVIAFHKRVLKEMNQYSSNYKNSFRTRFLINAFEEFSQSADKMNPRNIFYYSKVNGKFHLEVNSKYGSMKAHSNNQTAWRGDIKYSGSNNSVFLSSQRDTTRLTIKDEIFNTSFNSYIITHIPYPISPSKSGDFVISTNSRKRITRGKYKTKTNYAKIGIGELVESKAFRGVNLKAPLYLQLSEAVQSNYAMKNYLINNKRFYYCPSGEKMVWAYSYAELMNKQMEANSLSRDSTLYITIDKNLNDKLCRVLRAYSIEEGAIAVINNKGEILSIADNNTEAFNPNNKKGLNDFFENGKIGKNLISERGALGNYALMHMKNGPASTQKPLTYSAVMSQLKLDWASLKYLYRETSNRNVVRDSYLLSYAQRSLFEGEIDDRTKKLGLKLEGKDLSKVDVDYNSYLTNSVNMYHSLICYIGSYRSDDFEVKSMLNSKMTSADFPIFKYKNKKYAFSKAKQPPFSDQDDCEHSFLDEGFRYNYNLGIPNLLKEQTREIGSLGGPEKFKINQKLRSETKGKNDYQNAIKRTTLGSGAIWRISPLQMALASAQLFSLNNNLELTFLKDQENKLNAEFVLGTKNDNKDYNWNSLEEFHSVIKNQVYKPMHNVVASGTLKKIKGELKAAAGSYHLYAKTGTINSSNKTEKRDKLLILIVSKRDVSQLSLKELRKNKFCVFYFSLPNGKKEFYDIVKTALPELIKSSSFKNYMN